MTSDPWVVDRCHIYQDSRHQLIGHVIIFSSTHGSCLCLYFIFLLFPFALPVMSPVRGSSAPPRESVAPHYHMTSVLFEDSNGKVMM